MNGSSSRGLISNWSQEHRIRNESQLWGFLRARQKWKYFAAWAANFADLVAAPRPPLRRSSLSLLQGFGGRQPPKRAELEMSELGMRRIRNEPSVYTKSFIHECPFFKHCHMCISFAFNKKTLTHRSDSCLNASGCC